MSGYRDAGASEYRRALRGFIARSISPQMDIDENNKTLRQRGRMLYMSSPIATGAVNTNRTKVIGPGLTLNSAINRDVLGMSSEAAKAWQRKTEAEFRLWADKKENCDATGVQNFYGIQQLAVVSWLASGDVFSLFKRYDPTKTNPYSLRLHLVEADRVSTPTKMMLPSGVYNKTTGKAPSGNRIYDGVEVDAQGKIVAYHISDEYPDAQTLAGMNWQRIPAFGEKTGLPNILQIMNAERADQYRGITYLAQVIEPLLQINRYTQSELVAALVQSFFTAWIVSKTDPSEIPLNEVGSGVVGADGEPANIDGISKHPNEYEMGPGMVTHLQEGEDIKFGNPNVPTPGFEVFTKAIFQQIGAALEIPHDVLLKKFDASYSASRAALLEAWEGFRMRRKWMVEKLCQPVYEVWLAEAVARGRIKAPGFFEDPLLRAAWCGAHWIGPVQGHLDPLKEIRADILAIDRGIKTHEQVTREYGASDWYENAEQLKRESEMLAQVKEIMNPAVKDAWLSEPDEPEEENKEETK
ncbi:MAG: phage portal protein [Clostridiales bacterium]|nr:phage portal protein [Clostridiales bacterium]NLM85541.1 phage portal protein [Clostridiales bacterium]